MDNNRIWIGAMDSLIAGAGDPDVRAGVMKLLATIDAVKVTEHGATLDITNSDFVPDGYAETLTVDAETGVIRTMTGGKVGRTPASSSTTTSRASTPPTSSKASARAARRARAGAAGRLALVRIRGRGRPLRRRALRVLGPPDGEEDERHRDDARDPEDRKRDRFERHRVTREHDERGRGGQQRDDSGHLCAHTRRLRDNPPMSEPAWWQRGAIYQIYPRSFADANGDGVGDLAGITAHLDHIEALAAAAIWLSPIFTSPMADFGYDVSDYCDVDPVFGTLEDLDELIAACHARGIRVCSTGSRTTRPTGTRGSRSRAPAGTTPSATGTCGATRPTTGSQFKAVGPSWTLDPTTGQYYLHSFMAEQPDLNWDNPEVEAAMHDALRFWMDRGVDGLRLDAIHKIAKDPLLRDHAAPPRHDEDWETIHAACAGSAESSTNTTTA